MFQYQHPDDLLRQLTDERKRRERRAHLQRALRGANTPFGRSIVARLVEALRESRRAPLPKPRPSARMGR